MRVQSIVTAVAASLVLSACHTSRVITTPNLTATSPRQIYVTRVDGTQATVYTPRLEGEAIQGRSNGRECLLESCRKPDLTVQLADIKEIRIKTLDKPRTYGLIALGAAAVVGTAIAASGHGPDEGCVLNCMTRTGAQIPTSVLFTKLSQVGRFVGALTR